MSTLTVQVRLGITRGWRVRTLNEFRFYNQAVAHCLFIFSALRARGYKDRIWTLNYTVFMSGRKYSIYVEYFLLPDATEWKRGRQAYYCFTYTFHTTQIAGFMRNSNQLKYAFKSSIHNRFVAPFRRYAKRKSVTFVQNAIWGWSARTRMLHVLNSVFELNKPTFQTTLQNATEAAWANIARLAGRGNNLTTARLTRQAADVRLPLILSKSKYDAETTRYRWTMEKKAKERMLRNRTMNLLGTVSQELARTKAPRNRKYKAFCLFRSQLASALTRGLITQRVIQKRSLQKRSPEVVANQLTAAINMRTQRKHRRMVLAYKLAQRNARKSKEKFNQSFYEFCIKTERKIKLAKLKKLRDAQYGRR